MTIALKTEYRKFLADSLTPVSAYLRIRDLFPGAHLLESSDFSTEEECSSYILLDPISEFKVHALDVQILDPLDGVRRIRLSERAEAKALLRDYLRRFTPDAEYRITNGAFGYCSFSAGDIFTGVLRRKDDAPEIPDIFYQVFRYVVGINHYTGELALLKNIPNGETDGISLDALAHSLTQKSFPKYNFKAAGPLEQRISDQAALEKIKACTAEISRGGAEELCPSISYSQKFMGDEFNVYRALRSGHPGPYLFFCDYGSFKLFGSSPAPFLSVRGRTARLQVNAGGYPRGQTNYDDEKAASRLLAETDPNPQYASHVESARQDLQTLCGSALAKTTSEVRRYAHAMHLSTTIKGIISERIDSLDILDTAFPSSPLIGSPRHNALQFLESLESEPKRVSGGTVGFIGFNADANLASIVRSAVSIDNEIRFEASTGVVEASDPMKALGEMKTNARPLIDAIVLGGELV